MVDRMQRLGVRAPILLLGGIIVYTAIYCASVWLLSMNGYEKALVGGMVRKVLRK